MAIVLICNGFGLRSLDFGDSFPQLVVCFNWNKGSYS